MWQVISDWIVYLAGTLLIAGAVAGAIFNAVVLLWDLYLEWRRAPHQRSFQEGFKEARQILWKEAQWFREDESTLQLLVDLSRGVDTNDARDRWRQSRAKAAAAESAA